jgi:methyl-accepting chemotaxis protein
VASEVRNLAQRSAEAAKSTAAEIDQAVRTAAQGAEISAKVGTRLQEIASKAHEAEELAAEVATASREQNQGILQINTAVSEIDKVTQANAATAEESASAAGEFQAETKALGTAVGQLMQIIGQPSSLPEKTPVFSPTIEPTVPISKPPAWSLAKTGVRNLANNTPPVSQQRRF